MPLHRVSGALALLAVLLLILLFGGGDEGHPASSGPASSDGPVTARVTRVIDGDTIEVDLGGESEDVRYIGVDTPETVKPDTPVQCFGPEASERNHELVEGHTVRLEFDRERRDIYGRLLAYVFVGDRFINGELVRGGYARTLEIEPNTSRAGQFGRLASAAGEAGRGLWGQC
jgi:micrococcal nuclease